MSSFSYEVRFWEIRANAGKNRPYEVRWVVAGHEKSRSFTTKALARNWLAELVSAAKSGETFDIETGLPKSKLVSSVTWLQHATEFMDMKWPRAATNYRRNLANSLAAATLVLVRNHKGEPPRDVQRRALSCWAFNPLKRDGAMPDEIARALKWITSVSLPMAELESKAWARKVLDAMAVQANGKPASAASIATQRAHVGNAYLYAVELERIKVNPLNQVSWKPPKLDDELDLRVVVTPQQARSLLEAVARDRWSGPTLKAFFALLYFAGLRPGEAMALKPSDCFLPKSGWGRIALAGSRPGVSRAWSDDDAYFEDRPLKHRSERAVRYVPIPAELVQILREHIHSYDVANNIRLFLNTNGGTPDHGTYTAVWRRARVAVFSPEQVNSPLAWRP